MKTRKVLFAPQARNDLVDLHRGIFEAAGPEIAAVYLRRVEQFCRRFDLAAERGSRRDHIRPGLRVVGFERRLSIAFAVRPETVVILRIFPRGRNWERDFR